MLLPPLLDPAKLFFFLDVKEDLNSHDLKELRKLFSIPGYLESRADNVHFILCLIHECVSLDFERYMVEVFFPWANLKRRTTVHRERILQEFARIGQFPSGSPEDMAHLVQIYRSIVSDLFDPYITLIVASYQFINGSFENIDSSNLGQGERNKVEFILARKECAQLLSGYDGRVRNAISHSGSHGVTYKDGNIEFREISRSVPIRVIKVTWTVVELEKRIIDLFECIISIDAAENVFGIDCRDKIIDSPQIYLKFLYFHSDLNQRKNLSARLDMRFMEVRRNISLPIDEKLKILAPFILLNCSYRKMPVISLANSKDKEILSIFVPKGASILDDSALIERATEIVRYGILANTVFQDLFLNYRTIEVDEGGEEAGLAVISRGNLLEDYCKEKAGLVDLLNDSNFYENGKSISIKVNYDLLKGEEMNLLNDPFPRYER